MTWSVRAAKTLGGGGGGKPDVAQGGGQNPAAVGDAVAAVERLVAESGLSARCACAAAVGSPIDVGDARIGVASCDPDGILATPVETVPGRDVPAAHRRLAALVEEYEPIEVVVGLPRSLKGGEGPAAAKVRAFAQELARQHRARAGAAGGRADDDSHGQPGAARLGREVQEGPLGHRPGRRGGHPAERTGVRTGVR